MEQKLGFSELDFKKNLYKTRKYTFLAIKETPMPWAKQAALIEPDYPKVGHGRKAFPLESMLRVHLIGNLRDSLAASYIHRHLYIKLHLSERIVNIFFKT